MDTVTLLNIVNERLDRLRGDAELLTHALTTGVVLAAAEDAQATAAIDLDDRATWEAQRRTSGMKAAMQLALRDTRTIALDVASSIDRLRAATSVVK